MTRANAAESAARDLYEGLLTAWNDRDAEGFAAAFADDGTMVGFDGSQAFGRQDVLGHLSPIFQHHPTGRYLAKVTGCRGSAPTTSCCARSWACCRRDSQS